MKPKTLVLVGAIVVVIIAGVILWQSVFSSKSEPVTSEEPLESPGASPTTSTTEPRPFTIRPEGLPKGSFYIVKKGDTLWGIAKKFYGDGRKHKIISEVNRDVIPSPPLIKIGWKLFIPKLEPNRTETPSTPTRKSRPTKPPTPSGTPE